MKSTVTSRKSAGFTLAELLVIIAIIGVLVAIVFQVLSAQIGRTRTAVCQANRRSLKAALSIEYLLGDSDRFTDGSDITLTEDERKQYTCPSGGHFTASLKGSVITVKCDIPAHSDDASADEVERNKYANEFLGGIFKQLNNPDNSFTSYNLNVLNADYQGKTESETQKLLEAIGDGKGDKLKKFNANVWQAEKSGGVYKTFTWTAVTNQTSGSISGVPVIQYNYITNEYLVGDMTMIASEGGATNKVGRLSGTIKNTTAYSSYSEAFAAYEKLYAKYPNRGNIT